MPSTARASTGSSALKGSSSSPTWRFTKVMNMSDLSRDDDFLSHLLVEKLGTGGVPLLVHKMDPSRRLPKTDANDLLQIVRRLVVAKGQQSTVIRDAVDDLLMLSPVRYYLRTYMQKQVNAFATHASRYLELYLPTGSIEIAHTSRYAHRTGKSELCILAARPLTTGTVITELKGSMADLTDEEDRELKRANTAGISGIRRDFSVIHSKQLKKNHLFLGPARFVNHDCDNNVELFREGRYITFRVIKPISVGEEVTAHYGDDYFGRRNRHCLCQSCEKAGRGGYAAEDALQPTSGSDSDSDASEHSLSSSSDTEKDMEPLNVNERRTRRGVYAVMPEDKREREGSTAAKIELDVEEESTLMSISRSPSSAIPLGLATPNSMMLSRASSISSSLTSLSAEMDKISSKVPKRVIPLKPSTCMQAPFTSLKSTVLDGPTGSTQSSAHQLQTPPLSTETVATTSSIRSSARLQARAPTQPDRGRSQSSQVATPLKDVDETQGQQEVGRRKPSKSETQESRVLRPRPSLQAATESVSGGKAAKGEGSSKSTKESKKSIDKRLPTCSTCNGILPVISVDSEIVWGIEGLDERGKGKGKHKQEEKRECPRCMRHYAIYNVSWPNRVPTNGGTAFVPTPRHESSTPVDMTTSSRYMPKPATTNDRSASLSASLPIKAKSKPKQDEAEEDERPSKKRKLDVLPRGRTQMSAKSRSVLGVRGYRGGQARAPSQKLRENVPRQPAPVDGLKGASKDDSSTTPNMDKTMVQSQRAQSKFSFKVDASGHQKMVANIMKRSRAERANARTRMKAKMEKDAKGKSIQADYTVMTEDTAEEDDKEDVIGVSKKRFRDSETDETNERPYRRSRPSESDDEPDTMSRRLSMMGIQRSRYNGADETNERPYRRSRPSESADEPDTMSRRLLMMGIQRSRYNGASNLLSHAPNPLLFARRKWVPATPPEPEPELSPDENRHSWHGSTDESDGPVTPEDNDLTVSPKSDEEFRGTSANPIVPRARSFVGRGMNPSPVNFAMRRWSSLSSASNVRSATTSNPAGPSSEASTPPSVDSLHTNDFFDVGTHGQTVESTSHTPKPNKPSTYLPSRIWETDYINNQHSTPPGSPDSSRFVLRRKASFGSSPAVGSATDDSENIVEQLINEDSPPALNIAETDGGHSPTQFEKVMTIIGDAMQRFIDGSYPDRAKENPATLTCTAVSLPPPLQKEGCLSEMMPAASFVSPSPPASRLIKAGWDTDTEP